jgi:hypothetical protein
VISDLGELQLKSLLQIRHGLNLLFDFGTFSIDLGLNDSTLVLKQMGIFNLSLHEFDLHLLHLNLALVVFHLFGRIVDLDLDLVKFVNYCLDLSGETLTRSHCRIVVIFCIFGDHQLLLNFAFDLRFKFLLETLHLPLVNFHLVLIVLLFDVVLCNGLLDFIANRGILLHLNSAHFLLFG